MSNALELRSDPLRRILVATDFSETASLALDRALDLARAHGSEIALVHVMQPELPPLAAPEMVAIPPNYEEVLREACEEGLKQAAERVRDVGLVVTRHLEIGRAAQTVTECAKRLEADLILVGTRGNTGFKHLLLGSVAEEIVRTARRPVLTVHPGDDRSIEPVRAILFPTDFSPAADHALSTATRLLASSRDARIILLHAFQIAPTVVPLGGFGGGVAPMLVENAQELAEDATAPAAEALRARGFEVEVVVERGDTAEVVTELAAAREVDLIVMGTRGHSKLRQLLLGSTAERVVEHAPCPVMTVHEPEHA
jgi:nucleotide-binding universal stress UspA family protein